MGRLQDQPFSSSFVDRLKGDHSGNRETREIPRADYALVTPEPVTAPRLIAWSDDLARHFNLERPSADSLDLQILAGNHILPEMRPFAMNYGGYQFGSWAGQLGDGRAITLGEIVDVNGGKWELQLKGAGRTPFSRQGDGRAVLRSSLREFFASEALHYLRVPTTRSLSLVATGDAVLRDMFYDGNPCWEQGAIASRLAPTFVRFGNFELHTSRDEFTELKALTDWVMENHFPHLQPGDYLSWFNEICERTARLMVEWSRVGFVHGVMNTDNMSILGWTIDYGPFGFLDAYDTQWTPNTTDLPGRRYCFGAQPMIALWNLERLSEALEPLIPDDADDDLSSGLRLYITTFENEFKAMMAAKLGLDAVRGEEDVKLITDLDRLMQRSETDMTIFFRRLSESGDLMDAVSESFYGTPNDEFIAEMRSWLGRYQKRVSDLPADARRVKMNRVNPRIVPRNYLLFEVIEDVERGHTEKLDLLFEAIRDPYTDDSRFDSLFAKRPEWARTQPGSSTLSCSS